MDICTQVVVTVVVVLGVLAIGLVYLYLTNSFHRDHD